MNPQESPFANRDYATSFSYIEIDLPYRHLSRRSKRLYNSLQCRAVFSRKHDSRRVRLVNPTPLDLRTLRAKFPQLALSGLGLTLSLPGGLHDAAVERLAEELIYATLPSRNGLRLAGSHVTRLRIGAKTGEASFAALLELGPAALHYGRVYCLDDLFDDKLTEWLAPHFDSFWKRIAEQVGLVGSCAEQYLKWVRHETYQALREQFYGWAPEALDAELDAVLQAFNLVSDS